MDDLSGLSFTPSSSNEPKKPPPMSSGTLFPDVRRNDNSGRTTPLSTSSGRSNTPSKPATPAGDSFANLVSFGSSNPNKNLSLAEQQKRLQEERARKEAENRSRLETQYGAQNNQFWDTLEKGGKPAAPTPSQQPQSPDEDDILAAFNATAPVDASTHFPIPSHSPSPHVGTTPVQQPVSTKPAPAQDPMAIFDDDDPFGLGQMPSKPAPVPQPAQDDDDFLGELSKPVTEFSRPEPPPKPKAPEPEPEFESQFQSQPRPRAPPKPSTGVDRAIAELVDMGFPADKASQALSTTASGTDIQAAVGWLLTQAHEESRQKTGRRSRLEPHPSELERSRERGARRDPSWMREERPTVTRTRSDNRSPASAEKDPAQVAASFGNNFLKTANSLWKTGSKRMQQVVQDLNADHDPNQPRWMKEAAGFEEPLPQPRPRGRQQPSEPQGNVPRMTDEAILLESGGAPSRPSRNAPSRNPFQQHDVPRPTASSSDLRSQASSRERREPQPSFLRQQTREESRDSRSRINKLAVEEQSAQAYVSPARRKRPVPSPAPEPAVDLFDSPAPTSRPTPKPSPSPAPPSRPSTTPSIASLPTRPRAPPRTIPPVSQEALASTNRHRTKAADAYKRGDYAAAHESFATALTMLPDKHPITIIIRSNHAMTALKVGEPKSAITDADAMLDLIGPSKGENEQIDIGNTEPPKPMKDFFGKALMRKAEAQEQLERWADAASTWKLAVETGHGGGQSIQGRNRCEKAAGTSKPTSKPSTPARRPPAPTPKKPSALADLTGSAAASQNSEAVTRLREANQAAERADDEKFALTESVDARLAAWKGGKQDNLRALLGSLDTVLWPEAGWKKVNMSELIMPNKVKINYMKGIGKVHPDKIPTNATTEQRMISASVFATLNEAWDKFKRENSL
ncbi:UBA/TS-N domain protein [Aspergillus glaucus CBS 516.65]|uniref:UBA domain-containing protein n=1 Tax=Aspergillus glaucus CBS 516.65 TaxID=1160497 RepID=A0A1L9V9R8_ASPGL|nr:hypothetical protein ASPGLDRAFT_134145 [Aspergillus glaucus CBS 516.65]OJJ80649.1 hypothetical protein ASPGLDRAFT_134145 [Aspergillus glaucus CBS 516.65]